MKLNFSSLGSLEGFSGFEIKFKIVVIAEDERVEFFPFFGVGGQLQPLS